MQRVQKQDSESTNRTAQAKFTSKSHEIEHSNNIDDSPAMIAQRMKLQSLFGGAIQRQGAEEEMLQGKFETAQRVEEDEPLQGKFETAQRMGEEEPLQGKFEAVQRVEEKEPLQGKFETAQRVEKKEPLQGKFDAATSIQLKGEAAKPNNTGLPDNLKSGIESLSGMSMDNVKVHYNSSHPAQLNALAYAQGTDIHVAPGQERHLPHEAWHVVQQAQGRVKPTMQMKEGVPVNDDVGLEHEADVMGAKAVSLDSLSVQMKSLPTIGSVCIQPMKWTWMGGQWYPDDESTTNVPPALAGTKNGERHDDGIEPPPPIPSGYVALNLYGATVYLKDGGYRLDQVAHAHLVQGAQGVRGDGGWHQSARISGATQNDFYLHPSKKDPTLYLLKLGMHKDGNYLIDIVKDGTVSDGWHYF